MNNFLKYIKRNFDKNEGKTNTNVGLSLELLTHIFEGITNSVLENSYDEILYLSCSTPNLD